MEGNGGKERGGIWRDKGSLVWIREWEGRDLEGFNGNFLLGINLSQVGKI